LFFEEGAFAADGSLQYEREKAINKIGHALHDLDEAFADFSYSSKVANIAKQLGISVPVILQSMYICKQPFIGGEVTCHQDSTYLYVKNNPVTGFWFALEEATLDNGCLWAIPGGHRTAVKSRMLRLADDSIRNEIYDASPWPLEDMVPLPVPRGSLIILHGLLPHMSKMNTSAKSRHAYTLHMMSSEHEYATDNWLRR
jgi:phytanoyl-CoA hydroxylase